MKQILSPAAAAAMVANKASVMVGGFLNCGVPQTLIEALLAADVRELTLIVNDCGWPGKGVGKLVAAKRIARAVASHVGLNPLVSEQVNDNTLELELVPQGTLAERIRAAGAGLGGVLTPTGVGTPVAEGKQTLAINGRDYLLELPLLADVALVKAWKADSVGNLVHRRSARNVNPLMAMAARLVIAEVEEIVPAGSIDPDHVHTPGVLVDYLVQSTL